MMMPSDASTESAATAGDEARLGAGTERRLHPLSWLFVLLAQLRSFALPLVALLVFGDRGESWQWWGLVAVGVLTQARRPAISPTDFASTPTNW